MFQHLTNGQLIAIAIIGMVLFHVYLGVTVWLVVRQVKKTERATMSVIKQGYDAFARAHSVLRGEAL